MNDEMMFPMGGPEGPGGPGGGPGGPGGGPPM